ncbi:GTP cyclohydrolase I [Phytohabitans houttuyneae]|uniref:GTP cyclohydrolase 1 n=1 Tax=Phytohabitans houttuyneae TaxID=1076126 RepID=A0A6V8KRC1_9ACTN|nr:GTP cyclohydrolase I [Phytohabitans houttuyneae]GFJ84901.1 GTP cyclohydrolase 1 [Phytohabitans houttuyneae]
MTITTGTGERTPSPASNADTDVFAAVAAAESLLSALGLNGDTEHTLRTAERMVASYRDLLTPRPFEATTFSNHELHRDLVISRSVPFTSLCAHHVLPFIGTATVGYRPGTRLLGLSKLARVVEMFACRLQVQEDMTQQIAGWLDETVPDHGGAGVVITAEHLCMTIRGAEARGASTVTTAWRGELARDAALRAEFLSLATDR